MTNLLFDAEQIRRRGPGSRACHFTRRIDAPSAQSFSSMRS